VDPDNRSITRFDCRAAVCLPDKVCKVKKRLVQPGLIWSKTLSILLSTLCPKKHTDILCMKCYVCHAPYSVIANSHLRRQLKRIESHRIVGVNWPVAYLGFGKRGPWRARRARAYNEGLGAEPPAGSRGRAPGGGQGSEAPWNWITFCFWTFNRSRKFAYFFWDLLENGKKRTISYKVACKKNFHGRAKGGASHRAPPLNTPLELAIIHCLLNDFIHLSVKTASNKKKTK